MSPISRRNDSTLLKRAAKLHSSVLKDMKILTSKFAKTKTKTKKSKFTDVL